MSHLYKADVYQEHANLEADPYFDTMVPSDVTGLVGKTVELVCKVKNLGNRTVSALKMHIPLSPLAY